MQTLFSPTLSIEIEDMNSVETVLKPSLNELGISNWKAGRGIPARDGHACCTCCAASGAESQSE